MSAVPLIPASGTIELPAIFARELPSKLCVPRYIALKAIAKGAQILEYRVYSQTIPLGAFAHQIDECAYLIPFGSLEQRQKFWDQWNCSAEWREMHTKVSVTEIGVYRLGGSAPGRLLS